MKLNRKYEYKGIDLTLDVYEKVNAVVGMLAERDGRAFDDVLADFMASATYAALVTPQSLMWSETPRFIVEEYDRERS